MGNQHCFTAFLYIVLRDESFRLTLDLHLCIKKCLFSQRYSLISGILHLFSFHRHPNDNKNCIHSDIFCSLKVSLPIVCVRYCVWQRQSCLYVMSRPPFGACSITENHCLCITGRCIYRCALYSSLIHITLFSLQLSSSFHNINVIYIIPFLN